VQCVESFFFIFIQNIFSQVKYKHNGIERHVSLTAKLKTRTVELLTAALQKRRNGNNRT